MRTFVRMTAIVFAGLLGISSVGCATALRGDSQKMKFETDPSGASLKIDDQQYTAPAEVSLKRKDTHRVEVSKEGYRTKVFDLKAQWDGASLPGLILPGGSVSVALSKVVLRPSGSMEVMRECGLTMAVCFRYSSTDCFPVTYRPFML